MIPPPLPPTPAAGLDAGGRALALEPSAQFPGGSEGPEGRKEHLRGLCGPQAAARFIPFGVRAAALLRFEKPNEDTQNRLKIN